ncbi:DUF333 domain-containing protein [Paraburkholderia sp. Ac-20340]|uniref:putative hemolysin n=1 Tax=Paraburkholderia sp. Ac-20340 TaxID=2703888 RepID=UPI003217C63C
MLYRQGCTGFDRRSGSTQAELRQKPGVLAALWTGFADLTRRRIDMLAYPVANMKTIHFLPALPALVAIFAVTSACAQPLPMSAQSPARQQAAMANPASVNCIHNGGTLQIVETADGQTGICKLPNGHQCEEWALLRGDCQVGRP